MVNTGTHIGDLDHHFDQTHHRGIAANGIGSVKVGSGLLCVEFSDTRTGQFILYFRLFCCVRNDGSLAFIQQIGPLDCDLIDDVFGVMPHPPKE
jgi:hypothetical protein